MIAAFIGELAAALHGPRRLRRDLLAEVREGLHDAAAAHCTGGVSRPAAEARAVAEFGPVSELAPLYQAELTVTQARRTVVLLAVCFPMVHGMWELLGGTGRAWPSAPALAGQLVNALDVISGVTGGVALVGLLLLIRQARVRSAARPLAIAVGLFGGIAVLVGGGTAAMYLLAGPRATPLTALAWVLSGATLLAIIRSVGCTLRLGVAPPSSCVLSARRG